MVSNEKRNMYLNFKLPDYDVLDPNITAYELTLASLCQHNV